MKTIRPLWFILVAVALIACSHNVKELNSTKTNLLPTIFPDYQNITIPVNMAPLNFYIEEKGDDYRVEITPASGKPLTLSSSNGVVDIPLRRWRKMMTASKGAEMTIIVYVKNNEGKWLEYLPFKIAVSSDEIDSHLAYRLINVGYILWKKLGIYQRDLTSFDESPIMLNRNSNGNCMNCHSFSQQNPDRMMFHMRGKLSGTVIVDGDKVSKVNTKTPFTMAAAAYPSWHPDGKHIAFSVDLVNQWFHGVDKGNEVYDRASDIVVYDIDKNILTTSPAVSSRNREALPCWSPDGLQLYYCSTQPIRDSIAWNEVEYDLCRIAYNVQTNSWGQVDTVLTAREAGGSISFPKVSPDGEWIMFTRASHGYFTIFNKTSDLYMLNLKTGNIFPFPFNTNDVESYHTWSGNSKWVVFSSKRIDGLCTRPFFTHFDGKGNFSKPFVLPQKNPLFYRSYKNNYNVPELINGAVNMNNPALLKAVRNNALQAEFDKNVDVDGLSGASKIEQDALH